LIKELNTDPRRDGLRMKRVKLDDDLNRHLSLAGHGLDTILAKEEVCALRPNANHATGGSAIDVSDRVHPDNRDVAIRAAQAIGLDVAGVNFVTPDIDRSYREVGGGVIRIDYSPELRPHVWPAEGKPRDVGGAILETMFPSGDQGRVPLALVAGRRSDRVARILDRILCAAGMSAGLTIQGGAFVAGEPAAYDVTGRRQSAHALLWDQRIEALVSPIVPTEIVREGLLHDCCAVAAIMDPGNERDDSRKGLDVVVSATRDMLAVEASSAAALEAVRNIDPARLVMVSRNDRNDAVRNHLESGGKAMVTRSAEDRRMVVLCDNKNTILSVPADEVPGLANGRPDVKAHLFACALAYGMGVTADKIASILQATELTG
jgi:cyanophycin synthetase